MLVPKHMAFIMDGNGRWARQRGFPRSAGHRAGLEHIPDVLEVCREFGIHVVSAFAWTAGLPDVDLVFRTGGDRRVSSFMLWQGAYACIYIADAFWPDLSREDIEAGLAYYSRMMVKA